jgi:hypothetical protein
MALEQLSDQDALALTESLEEELSRGFIAARLNSITTGPCWWVC